MPTSIVRGRKKLPTVDVGIDRQAMLCRVVHISHASVWTKGVDQAPCAFLNRYYQLSFCDLAVNADTCAAGDSATMQSEGNDYSACHLATQNPKERVTERNRKRNSLADREVREPLGTDGKQIQGMGPLLNGKGFRQRITSLFRRVDVGQLNVLMTVCGLTHKSHIDPVRFTKMTRLRGEAFLHNGDASLIVFPTLQTYPRDKLLPNFKHRHRQRIGEERRRERNELSFS